MKKKYLAAWLTSASLLCWGGGAVSCSGHSHESDEHQHHDHEGHDHEADHDHEHEGHDHEHEGEDDEHAGSENHEHGDLIELKDETAKRFGVKTEKIEGSEFAEIITVSGRIESKATDESVATATRSGILTLSPGVTTGLKVNAGTSIGSISGSRVQGGDPSVQAIATRDAAKRELDRLAPLHKDGIVSTETYNNALKTYEEAEAALKSTRQGSGSVISLRSGVITQLLAQTGEYVEVGQKIAVVSGNTSLTLRADVPERYYGRLSAIETANFRPASSEEIFSIASLDGRLLSNPGTSTAQGGYIPVYFTFTNNGAIAPGSFAEVYLIGGKRHGVISVPKESIVEISGNKCVYTAEGPGHYAKHVVKTGATDGKRVEILSGLPAGEDVVTEGAQIVRMAETSGTAVPGHTHNH